MLTRYQVNDFSDKIREVTFEKETPHFFVSERGIRVKKSGRYESYFETFAEAKEFKVEKARGVMEYFKQKTAAANDALNRALALKLR